MTALALSALIFFAPAPAVSACPIGETVQPELLQPSSGIVIAEDVEGHVIVYDRDQRVVFEGDKLAGRPSRIGAPPGTYQIRLESRREALRVTIEVRSGEFTVVDRDRFSVPSGGRSRPAGTEDPTKATAGAGPPGDAVNHIEVRFGVYPAPSFSHEETEAEVHNNWADFGLGVEYLRYVSEDLAVGVSSFTRARTESSWTDRDHDDEIDRDRDSTRASNTTTFVSAVLRWNFLRRATSWHAVDPYVTGSLGPVFRRDSKTVERDDDRDRWSEVNTSFGGRIGLGIDAHLGKLMTLGVVGAWTWSTRPDEEIGYGRRDSGGEVALSVGFEWGRWPRRR